MRSILIYKDLTYLVDVILLISVSVDPQSSSSEMFVLSRCELGSDLRCDSYEFSYVGRLRAFSLFVDTRPSVSYVCFLSCA